MVRCMEKVFSNIIMVGSIREIFKNRSSLAKESGLIQRVIPIVESERMGKEKVLDYINGQVENNLRGNGKVIGRMDQAFLQIKMELS